MRTLLALVAATAMIVAALYVRGGGSDDGAGILPDLASDPASLVCIPELASVCEEIAGEDVELVIEEAGETAAALTSADAAAHDAWLTLAPWAQIAADARRRGGGPALPAAGEVLARSPLVLVVSQDRAPALDDECGGMLSWRCVGRVAGLPWSQIGGEETWGQVKPAFGDPQASGTGLLVVGQATAELLGDFSARTLDSDEFLAWSGRLERAVQDHGSATNTPLQQRIRLGPAGSDVIGTTEAEAAPLLQTPRAQAQRLALRYPETVAVAEVVLAPLRDGDGADRLRELLGESGGPALAKAGWRVAGEPAAPGVPSEPPLPPEPNLPSAGVLDALRARWGEITR